MIYTYIYYILYYNLYIVVNWKIHNIALKSNIENLMFLLTMLSEYTFLYTKYTICYFLLAINILFCDSGIKAAV